MYTEMYEVTRPHLLSERSDAFHCLHIALRVYTLAEMYVYIYIYIYPHKNNKQNKKKHICVYIYIYIYISYTYMGSRVLGLAAPISLNVKMAIPIHLETGGDQHLSALFIYKHVHICTHMYTYTYMHMYMYSYTTIHIYIYKYELQTSAKGTSCVNTFVEDKRTIFKR